MIDLLASHAPLWEKMQQLLLKKRVPQVLLFVGPRHVSMMHFTNRFMAALICEGEQKPCGDCRACRLLIQGIHPDITYITQEAPGSAIKIEQIRGLQQDIYQTPQRASRRFIVIDAAEKLNRAAENALLKILEEPPSHTIFILIADQIGSISATILSRCQKYFFPSPDVSETNYLSLGQFYPLDSSRREIGQHASSILESLCELVLEKISPCTLAAQWSTYGFDDLLWLLYLMTAQSIHHQLIKSNTETLDLGRDPLIRFSGMLTPVTLFHCLIKINAITKKIQHNMNMNQTLVLEDLLLSYIPSADEF